MGSSVMAGDVQINTYIVHDQREPSVAMGSDGDFVVTWEDAAQDGNGYGVFANFDNVQIRSAAGTITIVRGNF